MKVSLAVVALLMSCLGPSSRAPATNRPGAAAPPPNIVVVITDDQGYGPVGAHGHPWIRTPNMDRLYRESTRLTRFLVAPTCAPTRSALMTGRHPMRNGVTHTILERERMTPSATTLPQALASVGYTTGIFGKWHLGDEDAYQPRNRGFDEEFIHGAGGIGQRYKCSCADAPGNKYFDPVLRHNGKFVKTSGYCTDLFFTAALGWIRDSKDAGKPFFAYIATNAPHGPFIAPPSNTKHFKDMGFADKTAGFYGMIENIDENLGRLLDKLDAWQLAENTIVVFMSDNGMTGGGSGRPGVDLAPGYPNFNAGMKGLKGSADEGGVRVPFFVRWPGKALANRDLGIVAAHIDFFPTLTAIAGAENPTGQVEGRSFLPHLLGESVAWPKRFLVTHKGRWRTGADPNSHQWRNFAIRSPRYRWVGQGKNGGALYDMIHDPAQRTNVIEKHPAVIADMKRFYDAWWKRTVPMMVNEKAPMSPTRPFHVAYYAQQEQGGIPQWKPPILDD